MGASPHIAVILVAAGSGSRLGGNVPKAYQMLGGQPLIMRAAQAFQRAGMATIQPVIHPDHADLCDTALAGLACLPPVHGGATRQASVKAGLDALAEHAPNYVMIHDAARALVSPLLITNIANALNEHDAVVPALPVHDTLRRNTGEEVPRDGLLRMQTPQAFAFAEIHLLHQAAAIYEEGGQDARPSLERASSRRQEGRSGKQHKTPSGEGASHQPAKRREGLGSMPMPEALNKATDDAALWLASGKLVHYVNGQETNRKMTVQSDMVWAEEQLANNRISKSAMGYDVHKTVPQQTGSITLGGHTFHSPVALEGHSDADVVLHAITDALLGSIAAGDIGQHFPPSDAKWKGADSAQFVQHAMALLAQHGAVLNHIDVTIICEAPKISPERDAIRQSIARITGLPISAVSVKATTTEGLGFTGRGEGIACQAVVSVEVPRA